MQHVQDHPSQIPAMLNEAYRRHAAGEIAVAEVLYRRVLAMEPKNFNALHMLAVVGYSTDQIAPALELFAKAKAINSNDVALMVNYGAALKKNKQYHEALVCYDKALAVNPNLFEALFNKASCCFELEDVDAANVLYRRCLELKPDNSEIERCIGNCARVKGDWQNAMEWYERSVTSDPKSAPGFVSIAQICRDRGWLASALVMCAKALEIDPRNEGALTISSLVSLKRGDLETGWKHYEGRFWYADDQVFRRTVPPMYWSGENLSGKKILVWSEQGVGDEILYASMLPDLAQLGARIIFECDPRMVPVYARSFPTVDVRGWIKRNTSSTPARELDFQSSVVSLGRFFRPNLAAFPKRSSYLKADSAKVRALRARYGEGPLVGVSWRSKAARNVGTKKSSDLIYWESVLRTPGVKFVNLQYGDCAEDLAVIRDRFGIEIINDPEIDSLTDMDSFFAQVAAMDLVISTSNTTIHVAGSQGVPTWMLISERHMSLWYWFTKERNSPWYPSLQIYRHVAKDENHHHWSQGLLQKVSADLSDWLTRSGRL
jgi:tetratricopeptide (TPR) repeat protein